MPLGKALMFNPPKQPQIYFHSGLAKAASTMLQRQVFPLLSGITFINKKNYGLHRNQDFVNQHEKILFSFEFHKFLPQKLEEISRLYPEAKIILVFREHASWLESKYRYHVRKHGKESFEEYFDLEKDKGIIRQEEIVYRNIIETARSHFSHSPLCLNYHYLKENPDAFFQPLFDYLEVKPPILPQKGKVMNKAFSNKQIHYLLKLNRGYHYHPMQSSSKLWNKIHYKYREFLLHTWAFISQVFPDPNPGMPLVSAELKDRIQEMYREDWAYCMGEMAGK